MRTCEPHPPPDRAWDLMKGTAYRVRVRGRVIKARFLGEALRFGGNPQTPYSTALCYDLRVVSTGRIVTVFALRDFV